MDLVFFLTITIRLLATTMSLVLAHRLRDWRIGFLAAMLALTLIHQGLMWWSATPAGGVSPIGALSEVSELAVSIMALLAILFLRRILGKGRQREAALQRQVDQTSALLEVGQAITGSLDLQEVLDMIVARACSLLHTQRAGLALITYEGNDMVPRFVAQRGLSSTFITRIRPRHWRDGTTFMAITKRRPIWSADLLNDPAFELTPGTRAAVEAEGYRAVLSVPLLSGDEVLGALVVYRDDPGPFAPAEVDLLQAFAAQATIAIKNAQLYRNLENRLARLQTLTRLNQFISSSLDIDTVLAEIARAAAVLLQAPSVSFWLADESREILELRAFWEEIADRERPQKILRFGQGGVGWVARHRQPLQIDDTFSDERIVGREWRKAYGLRSFFALPVFLEDSLLAVLALNGQQPFRFGPDEQALLESFVAQAAVAIRNASLYRELQASEERFRQLTEHIQAVFWMTDAQSTRVLYVSPAYEKIWGRSCQSLYERFRSWIEAVHPEDQERIRAALSRQKQGTYDEEYRIVRPDGTIRWIRDRAFPVQNAQGEVYRIAGIAEDITERKAVEEALQESEERYRSLVEHAPVAIWVYFDGEIAYVNDAGMRLLGASDPRQLIGQNFFEFISPPARARYEERIRTLLRERTGTPLTEEEIVRLDGNIATVEMASIPIFYRQRPAVLSVANDISERKRLEAQLRQAQKMEAIGTLAGGIAHDFNNILTAILGYTELTLRNMPEESEAYQNLQEVLAAGKRAKELVQQILTFSRQHEQRYQPVQLRQVVQEVLRLVRATLPSTIEIRQYLDTPGTVLADPGQIHQVLLNLCSNAEYAMRERGGILEVRLEKTQITPEFAAAHPPLHPGPYLQLSICDTGCGMEPAILDRIFDPFFTTKGVGEGTGMGLAIVHGIVTSHGGAITVESLPGQGTTFTLYFPQIDDVLDSMGDNEPALPRGKETILLVEDEPALAALGEQMLTMLGYRVIAYTDSLKALEAFRADPQRFDLVLTDQTMPNMTGEALSRELLRIRPDLPIILYTGFSHTMTPEKARALGIRAYLMKPLVWRDLALTIRQVLEA